MEVIGIGTASVSHHVKIQTSTASIFQLLSPLPPPPFNLTQRQTMPHSKGPSRMNKLLSVRMDLTELELHVPRIGSWSGRRGVLGSSEYTVPLPLLIMAQRILYETKRNTSFLPKIRLYKNNTVKSFDCFSSKTKSFYCRCVSQDCFI